MYSSSQEYEIGVGDGWGHIQLQNVLLSPSMHDHMASFDDCGQSVTDAIGFVFIYNIEAKGRPSPHM